VKELETNSLNDRIAEEIENPTDYAGELEQIASPIELPKETLEFFNADELRARVFYEKYALKDMNGRVVEQTPVDMWARVARELASVEATEEKRSEWAKKFYWLLENFRFVPGGRIMFGAGQPRRSTLLNCYFIPVQSDSLEDIFDFCKEAGRTYSFGGGVGTDISILRPKGAPVNNSAVVSTGSVSFMELFSVTTGTIGQAGRRGALMITIHVDHPDVVDFIDVKRDLTRVNHANISVCITDKFMQAVQNDENFALAFKNDKADVKRVVKARELWDKLVRSAWESAEPGIIFWDNVKNESPTEYNGMEVHGFNPCVVGSTLVLTETGWKRVDSLTQGEHIVTAYGSTKPITKVYVFENSDVYRVRFTDGGEILATPDHIFHSRTGRITDKSWNKFWDKEKRLRDLKAGDLVRVPRITSIPNQEIETHGLKNRDFGFRVGILLGDGCYTQKVLANNGAKIATDLREKEWNEKILSSFKDISPRARLVSCSNGSDNAAYILLYKEGTKFIQESTLLGQVKSFDKEIPLEYVNSNKEFHVGLIDALFSTDGNIDLNKSNPVARLSSSSLKLLQSIRLILLFYGIHSKIYNHKIKPHQFLGRTITPKHRAYNLSIYGHDLLKFASTFSLSYAVKQKKLDLIKDMSNGASSDFTRIDKIEYAGKQTVYDIFEQETDTWITEGYASRGCSEQCLEDYGCCCLGNINLSQFVVDEFSERARLDWRNLEKALRYGTRFLDNVLDYNSDKHPLPQQTKASMWSRRIGVGFTGLADMLIKLNLKYDSAQSVKFIDRMFDRVKNICYDESCNIAVEKGPAPAFIAEKHLARPFIQRLDGNVKQKIASHGVRNSCVLTVPPVGSGAIIAGTTSGIEPIFALSYVRKSKSLSGGEFKVYHPLVQDYMKRFGLRSESELPDIFVTAHSIKAEFRVQMQGTIQKHIDSSISSTVNIPKEATVQDVKDIYFQAWRAGCKGITVYREGAREGILLTNEEAASQKGIGSKPHKFERPKVLTGQTVKMKVPQGSLYVTANKNGDDIIRETFVTLGKSGGDEKADAEAIGRLISLYLQHGGKINEVIQTLKGIQGRDVSWDNGQQLLSVPDAVAKALASLTGTTVEKEQQLKHCPDCGEASIIFENGCYRCSSCGYSKCN
jgi:ribonucleoside-diphosphate reductase alpha chain